MIYPLVILILWFAGLLAFYLSVRSAFLKWLGLALIIAGTLLISSQIIRLWIILERPPIRTLGETRLWYSFFLSVVGLVIYFRWKYKWVPAFGLLFSALFVIINMIHPENFDKTLMPALQSPWFVPHVIVYMFAYALLGFSALVAIFGLYSQARGKFETGIMIKADNLVYAGFSFLTFGLLFGALWAKEAWGHYWTWDPKETWSFITWLLYLLYIHYRHQYRNQLKWALWILALAFVILLICWFGINYLPSAQNSVHTYSG
jgi:ABC-type transport system involved in cytochrome c biogenesis permease subunit